MSNYEQDIDYTAEEVGAWVKSLGADRPCPACATTKWALSKYDDTLGYAIPVAETDGGIFTRHMKVLVLVCTNCSLMRMHQLKPFVEWRRKLKGGGES